MPSDLRPPNRPALTSWKEIAHFFEREVRTVQRWEKEEGLPVHRHMHRRQSSVYAYRDELETWWRERGAVLKPEELEGPVPGEIPTRALSWKVVTLSVALMVVVAVVMVALNQVADSNVAALPVLKLDLKDPAASHPQGTFTGDVNGDGVADLTVSDDVLNETYILFGGSLPAASRPIVEAAGVTLKGMERGSWIGRVIGDLNGDGVADVLVTQLLSEPETFTATGPSYLVWGRRQWPASLRLPEAADVKLTLKWNTDARLSGCYSPGPIDLNDDGIDDAVLSAQEYGPPERRSSGGLFVLYGRSQWPKELEVSSAANIAILGSRTGEGLAGSCAAGDFTADGHTDLAVAAGESVLWNLLGGRGRIYVFAGSKSWPRRMDAATDFHLRVDGATPKNDWAHVVLADINGDGADDLVYSRGWSEAYDRAGSLRVFYGGSERKGIVTEDDADKILVGSAPENQLGTGLIVADVDGDGCADVVTAEGSSGRILMLRGCEDWPARGTIESTKPMELARGGRGAGYWRISIDDLDGDAFPELAFTTWWETPQRETSLGPVTIAKIHRTVEVDVRPLYTNNVVLYPGVVVARVHGFSKKDGDQIDPASVRLAGAAPTHTVVQDYNGDGIPDVQAQFNTTQMRITADSARTQMLARTRSGRLVGGSDSIVVVPTEAPPVAADRGAKNGN